MCAAIQSNFTTGLRRAPAKFRKGLRYGFVGTAIWETSGPLADTKGRVAIQIRDLDQTVIGNPANDLIRLGLPLASAARGSNLPGVTTARILEQLVSGYEKALSDDIERG